MPRQKSGSSDAKDDPARKAEEKPVDYDKIAEENATRIRAEPALAG